MRVSCENATDPPTQDVNDLLDALEQARIVVLRGISRIAWRLRQRHTKFGVQVEVKTEK